MYQNYINVKEFDISKFKLDYVPHDNKSFMGISCALPLYDYGYGEFDKLIVVTGPIVLSKHGIPSLNNDKYHTNENDCHYMTISIDDCEGGREFRDNVLLPLDELFNKKINIDKNKDGFVRKLSTDNKLVDMPRLYYTNFINLYPYYFESNENEDADEYKDKPMVFKQHNIIKLKFVTKYDDTINRDIERELLINVYTKDEKTGEPKEEPEKVKYNDDLRKYVKLNCTVQFVIEFTKLWIMKHSCYDYMGKTPVYNCGIGARILQIYVVDAK
jgi:hypothetical protein